MGFSKWYAGMSNARNRRGDSVDLVDRDSEANASVCERTINVNREHSQESQSKEDFEKRGNWKRQENRQLFDGKRRTYESRKSGMFS